MWITNCCLRQDLLFGKFNMSLGGLRGSFFLARWILPVLFWISKVCGKGNRWPFARSVEHEGLRIQGNIVYSCLGRETLITKLVSAGGVWSLRLCKVRRLHRYEGGRLCELARLVCQSQEWVFMQLTFQVKGDHLLCLKESVFCPWAWSFKLTTYFYRRSLDRQSTGCCFFFPLFVKFSSFLTCCFSYWTAACWTAPDVNIDVTCPKAFKIELIYIV